MAKQLSQVAQRQITKKRIDHKFTFKINGVDRSNYVFDYSVSFDKSFGSATASFTLLNSGGIFGDVGAWQVKVGDIVELFESFGGDTVEYKSFYGVVDQRSINKSATERSIVLNCLDYVTTLQKTDIDLEVEGTKVKIEDETLEPVFLPSPNESLAQVFNFANNSIASVPPASITIRPKASTTLIGESPQFDGFEIRNAEGQVLLGTPLNALDNYYIASTYYFYTQGVFIEDIIEQILTEPDGYGKYMFGELSAQAVIDNHLTTNFSDEEGTTVDYLSPNASSSSIIIKTKLSVAFDPSASGADPTTLNVLSTEGFPNSGTANLSGDIFTYTGKTSTSFTGIPVSGEGSLKAHPVESYVSYETTYDAGQVWYFKYSNITSDLDESGNSFENLPSGVTIDYIDYRYGRIILSSAIDQSTILKHNGNYTFKTLQATGITLNRIRFTAREVDNRFEAINRLRDYTAPNYIVRTKGDNKIWSSYLTQAFNPDYTLELVEKLNYLEDDDLYTRVVFYGKNKNPKNIMFQDGVQFVSSGQEFKATAVQSELQFEKEEDNYQVYKTTISDAGRIDISTIKPLIYINNVPVNDKPQIIAQMPVVISVTSRVETTVQEKRSGSPDVTVRQYFYYRLRFAHTSIDPTQEIKIYDAVGLTLLTIPPNSSSMDYGNGIYTVPGDSQNGTIEQASTASYTVFYSLSGILIDTETVRFKISKKLIPTVNFAIVAATFQYWTALTPFNDVGSIIDGRFETQVQTEFFAEPPDGLPYAILDLGQIYSIQALDIVAGFYKADEIRKFDIGFKFSLEYSFDNIEYFVVSPETQNVEMSGGSHKSFEEKDLGVDFRARYLKLNLEQVKKINYNATGTASSDANIGVWPVAFSEIAAYGDIVLKGEATLIATSFLSDDVIISTLDSSGQYQTSITVDDASQFEIPSSGETATAYIGEDSFTYTDITSGNTFVGVEGLSEDHTLGERVTQSLAGDNSMYDDLGLLKQLGDRLFKQIKIRDDILYDQTQIDRLARAYLAEFYKNHTKVQVDVVYGCHLKVGQTVAVTDSYQGISAVNYFIESISNKNGNLSLVLARYPA